MKKTGRIILTATIIILISSTVILSMIKASADREIIKRVSEGGVDAVEEAVPIVEVYVTGEVMQPGIVEIEKGSTILEAVNKCGGLTETASSNINLVYSLDKNVTLIIKARDDGGGAVVLEEPGDAVLIYNESGLIDGKININNADVASLVLLPGVGEKTAQDIITFREVEGPFIMIDDIMKVPGIKDSKFDKIKDYISIE